MEIGSSFRSSSNLGTKMKKDADTVSIFGRTFGWVALCLCAGTIPAKAQSLFPAQNMGAKSLGLSYTYGLVGQNITEAETPSHESHHLVSIGYAPIPYAGVEAGLGLSRFSVDPQNQVRFKGNYGLSPSLGIYCNTPSFAGDMLRVTAGAKASFFKSEDDRGYSYSTSIVKPGLGLVFSPNEFVDLALGARLHLMQGLMNSSRMQAEIEFANSDIFRGYFAFIVKTPFERAFLQVDLDLSPSVDADWSDGPREASIGLSFGTLLGWKGKSTSPEKTDLPTYFPAYPEMKDRQKKMAEELE